MVFGNGAVKHPKPSDAEAKEKETLMMTPELIGDLRLTDQSGSTSTSSTSNDVNDEHKTFVVNDVESADEEGLERQEWSRKTEYVLSMIGFSVGLGNIWRFPYVCIRNGGGAFLIPFFVCLIICGMPLYFLEVSMGQFVSKSSYHVWRLCPLFGGIGITMNIVSAVYFWYSMIILAWTVIYLVNSMKSPLPWTLCDQEWNTKACVPPGGLMKNVSEEGLAQNGSFFAGFGTNSSIERNVTLGNLTSTSVAARSASEEFWLYNVLQLSSGLEDLGGLPWSNSVAQVVCIILVFACIIKGVSSVGKVVYITATLPYILITVLVIKGATLPGALDGVIFYLKPDFPKLLKLQTWVEACLQVFYSLGPAWGGLLTMASYNKFHNNCFRDAVILTLICEGTSVYAGFATFTVLGYMSVTLNVPITNFNSTGAGLAFVAYPEAISYLPVPQLWGVLFFIMLLTLGLDTMFVTGETFITTLGDMFVPLLRKYDVYFKCICCCLMMVLSLPFASRGGMYLFQLCDWYTAAFSPLAIGILECVVVSWIYGADRFFEDIKLMIGRRPPFFVLILWSVVTPIMLLCILFFTICTYTSPTVEGYEYSTVALAFGWCLALVSFLPVILIAVYRWCQAKGSFIERLRKACVPSNDWGPSDPKYRAQYKLDNKPEELHTFRVPFLRNYPENVL